MIYNTNYIPYDISNIKRRQLELNYHSKYHCLVMSILVDIYYDKTTDKYCVILNNGLLTENELQDVFMVLRTEYKLPINEIIADYTHSLTAQLSFIRYGYNKSGKLRPLTMRTFRFSGGMFNRACLADYIYRIYGELRLKGLMVELNS